MSAPTTAPHSTEAAISVLGACLQDFEAAKHAEARIGAQR